MHQETIIIAYLKQNKLVTMCGIFPLPHFQKVAEGALFLLRCIGEMVVDIATKRAGLDEAFHLSGFPTSFSVSSAAAMSLHLSGDAYFGRDFIAKVDCEGELPGPLSASATLSSGSRVEASIEGYSTFLPGLF